MSVQKKLKRNEIETLHRFTLDLPGHVWDALSRAASAVGNKPTHTARQWLAERAAEEASKKAE